MYIFNIIQKAYTYISEIKLTNFLYSKLVPKIKSLLYNACVKSYTSREAYSSLCLICVNIVNFIILINKIKKYCIA